MQKFINDSAVKLSNASSYEDVYKIIVESLKAITNSRSIVVSTYNKEKKATKIKHYDIESNILNQVVSLYGDKKLLETEFPVSDEGFEIIKNGPIKIVETLYEATFGNVPKIGGAMVQKIQGIDKYLGLAYFVDNEFFGTTLIGLDKKSNVPDKDILESFVQMVSFALKRIMVEEQLMGSEENFRNLVNKMQLGLAVHEIILDGNGNPADYLFLNINPAFERLTGLKRVDVVGKTVLEILPGTEKIWIEKYGHVAITGEPIQFEQYSSELRRYYSVIAYRPENKQFAVIIEDVTERRRSQFELQKTKDRFQVISDNMLDMVALTDMAGNYKFVGKSHNILGYDIESLIGKNVLDFVHPDDLEDVKSKFADFVTNSETKSEAEVIYRYCCADGSYLWFETFGVLIYDEAGTPKEILFNTRDITDRKRAEAELLDRERRLQKIFEVLPIGLWFADENGKLIMGNPAGVKIWGAEPTVGIEEYGVFKARRLPEYKEIEGEDWALAKTVKEGVVVENELLEIDAFDGKKKVILNYTAPILDDENQVKGAIVINQEVTEKYKYEEELKESEEKYRLIAENMGNVVTMLDMNLNFTYVTPNILKVRGFTVEEILNQKIEESMAPESLQQVMKLFQEEMALEMSGTADPQRSRVLDLEEYRKDGSTIWMENVLSFVRDKSGKPIGVLAVSRDITEKVEAEAEKERLSEQLIHAQKMESVGTLAGGIAHDFNNLLQVIGGYTSILLQERNISQKDLERLKEVEKAVDRGSSLVQNLLTFSRKTGSSRKIIDLNSEVKTVEKLLRSTLPKMIEIKTDLNPELSKINADPIQIEQILLNLSKNGADAMPGGGTLTIKTDNIDINGEAECCCGGIVPGKYVVLIIEDTGSGIDQEHLDNIFDPFFTTKEVGKGTGLGLATAYGIVVNHGGHIHCESEVGVGTKFLIYLPISEIQQEEKKVITEDVPNRDGHETIMIVDDEAAIRELQSDTLKEFGYKVILAENGEEAIATYTEKRNDIDLIVMDLGMPGMGGQKCLAELKKINPQIKVIIASGYSSTEQIEELISTGANGFVAKPYKLKNMLDTIREVLDKD
jgi:PAS domain S-box-containing protein